MARHLDLALLDTGNGDALTFARYGADFAVEKLACGKRLPELIDFRDRIEKAVSGALKRPTFKELVSFGEQLYRTLIFGSVEKLFATAAAGNEDVRLHIVSNHPALQSLPWEFFQEPGQPSGPHKNRSVVRIFLGQSKPLLPPLKLGESLRVVLAYAEPNKEDPVPWPEVEQKMTDTFHREIPETWKLVIVRGSNLTELDGAISEGCQIFHFLGHGDVRNGEGVLLLEGGELTASVLSGLLGASGIHMVVLSACKTAAGDFSSNFSVTAQTLLASGIPVVLANQLSIPTPSIAPFVGKFYKCLLATGDVDRSVAEARVLLNASLSLSADRSEATFEWGIPTLYRNIELQRFFES